MAPPIKGPHSGGPKSSCLKKNARLFTEYDSRFIYYDCSVPAIAWDGWSVLSSGATLLASGFDGLRASCWRIFQMDTAPLISINTAAPRYSIHAYGFTGCPGSVKSVFP